MPQHTRNILIVDDVSQNRAMLKAALTRQGYGTEECSDGKECLAYCQKKLPSLVLLDVMMPGIDGIEVCRRLREKHSHLELPIILVSAKSEDECIVNGIAAGANDYITKPFKKQVLLSRLECQLTASAAAKEIADQRKIAERVLKIQTTIGDVFPGALAVTVGDGSIFSSNQELIRACNGRNPVNLNESLELMYNGRLEGIFKRFLDTVDLKTPIALDEEFCVEDPHLNVRVISRPVQIEDEEQMRLWLWLDVSGQRQLERDIQQQVKLDTVSLFATGVAHNFNNILGGILGAVGLLQNKLSDEDRVAQRCLSLIQKGVDGAASLIKKMLVISKRDGKESCGSLDAIDLGILNIIEIQKEMTQGKIEFLVNLPETFPTIEINFLSLMEIISNIVANAVESIKGNGKVSVEAACEGDNTIKIVISDDGSGMDEATLKRIYEPFFSTRNLDYANGVNLEGRGLGMWNVYNLVKMAGGNIEIQSSPGKGTKVAVRLPTRI